MQSLHPGHKALFPARSAAARGCGSPGTAACEGVGWGCQRLAKYSPVSMETGSPHLKLQCSRCSPLTGLMGDEKLMFDLHLIAVLWDHSPGPSAGVAQSPGRLPLAVEPKSPNPQILHRRCQLRAAAGHVLPCWGRHAVACSFGLRFGLVKPKPSQQGWITGALLEVWGWQLLGLGLLLVFPLLPGSTSTGCQPGGARASVSHS